MQYQIPQIRLSQDKTRPNMRECLRQFFLANPDEELTIEDIMTKWSCTKRAAQEAVSVLAKTGECEPVTIIKAGKRKH